MNPVFLCQATSITAALWALPDALSSPLQCSLAVRKAQVSPSPAVLLRRALGSTASGDVSLQSTWIVRADSNDLSSAGISRREGEYTCSENHPSAKS